jgi:hypothetical protein
MMGYELYIAKPGKQQATISQCEDVIGESYAPDMRLAVKEWRLRAKTSRKLSLGLKIPG